MVRYILLLLIFVITINPTLHSQHPDFTKNIWPSEYSEVENKKEVTPYETYLDLAGIKNRIGLRSEFTHKLDSILGWSQEGNFEINTRKSEFRFEYEKNTDLLLAFRRDKNNDNWEPRLSILSNYKNNLLVKHSYTNWNGATFNFDHSNAYSIREYSYNAQNQLILYEDQNQIAIDNNRITNRKVYHYDSLALATGISHYFWYSNDDTISHVRETIYHYNDQDHLESIVNSRFDFGDGWINSDSTYLFYSVEGKVIEQTKYHWTIDNIFEPYEKTIYFYSENGKINKELVRWQFNSDENEFRFKTMYDLEFYNYGSLKKRASFDSLSFAMPKDDNQTWSYKHNEQIYSDRTMIPRYMNYEESREHNEVYVLEEYENYRGLGYFSSGRTLESRQQYFYSEIDGVSTNEPIKADSNNLKVSPNPAIDDLRFEVLDYSGNLNIVIYNINGQKILKKEVVNTGDVDVSLLSSGVYFYTVRVGDDLLSGRFLKD